MVLLGERSNGFQLLGYNSKLCFSCFSIPNMITFQLIKQKQNKKENYLKNIIKQSLEKGLIKLYRFEEGCTRANIYLKKFMCLLVGRYFDTKIS